MHIIHNNVATDHQYVTPDRIAYFCKVYYEKVDNLVWLVQLCIVRRLKALEEVHSLHDQDNEFLYLYFSI